MSQYLVNKSTVKSNINSLKSAFKKSNIDFQLFYSVKTNSAKLILQIIKDENCKYEILSKLEWGKIKTFQPKSLVINGPAKSLKLIREILQQVDCLYFNIDNDVDLQIIERLSFDEHLFSRLKIGIRVFLNKEGVWNRFGYEINSDRLNEIILFLKEKNWLHGFHFHFSTNNFSLNNYDLLLNRLKNIVDKNEIELQYLDIGGGLPAANDILYKKTIYEKLPALIELTFSDVLIISEAGRNIVSDAMDLETQIISYKKISENKFQVNLDANVLHFPCFYTKKHWIEFLPKNDEVKNPVEIEVFGNSCMQIDKISDFILVKQKPKVGDTVIIHDIGAYSISQASNFISSIPKVKYEDE